MIVLLPAPDSADAERGGLAHAYKPLPRLLVQPVGGEDAAQVDVAP